MIKRKVNYYFGIGFVVAIGLIGAGFLAKLTTVRAESIPESPTVTVAPSVEPSATPVVTATPSITPVATDSPMPQLTVEPSPSPTPHIPALKKVSGVKLVRYSTNAVKVTWKKHKKTTYYRVYYAKKKNGKYHLAGVTKKRQFLVKKLKNKTTYYFYVRASRKKKSSPSDSTPSDKKRMTMKSYGRKIIFAGDSICQGIAYPGWAYPYMSIEGKKKVIAYRGLNTVTFHTKRIFRGKTGLQKLIAERPYRVYMMLGMNEIPFRKTSIMIAEYKSMIQAIKQACPDADIVLCAISPVTRAERARHPGCGQIPVFNKKLKALAKRTGCRYFDYTAFLKDSGGYLKAQYAEGDGYHWKSPTYATFARVVSKYDKGLDQ